jgi:hypothetical protein
VTNAHRLIWLAGLLLPLFWVLALCWLFNLSDLRESYTNLAAEHRELQLRIDQGDEGARSASGDSLGDTFEYLSTAARAYLRVLEGVLFFGVLPLLVIWFCLGVWGFLGFRGVAIGASKRAEIFE